MPPRNLTDTVITNSPSVALALTRHGRLDVVLDPDGNLVELSAAG